MPFQNKGLWLSKDGGCLTDGEISYDSVSRIEPKRSHQWLMDGEAALFPSKKQAVEVSGGNSLGGIPASSHSPWGSATGFNFVPSQLTEQLFDPHAVRETNFEEGNISSVNVGSLQLGRKVIDDSFETNASLGVSLSHSLEDPNSGINYGGIKKIKVSEVRDPKNLISICSGPSYSIKANGGISTVHGYDKVDNSSISMGLTFGQEEENVVSNGDSYGTEDGNFVSMGPSYTKDACNALAMGNPYKADGSTMQMANSFSGADCNIMPLARNFSKGVDNDIISLSHTYKGDGSITVTHEYNKGDNLTTAISHSNSKCERPALSMAHSFNKGERSIISFGSYNDDGVADAPGRLMCNYDLLIGQSSVQRCNTLNQKDLIVSNGNASIVAAAQAIAPGVESISRKKEDTKSLKKTPPNNFPSNVRSLLATGILDEVPVKYITWSREKELRGIIKGSGYLCGCQPCNFSKVINAYEFERHAGCKTKHPNNHIYFENGKTIYGIVQELRNTPQNMLFDVIQTITGSPINQKSFRLWKESFLAATRELQRIYGKDERNQLL